MNIIFYSVIVLGIIGIIAAAILWFAAKKFHVAEDPRISEIEQLLPGANCGGCGLTGCHAFAEACAKADSLDNLHCTGITEAEYAQIGKITGLAATSGPQQRAVVKCSASCERRPEVTEYEGPRSCAIENSTYQGESDCNYGCLGCGDCVAVCPFDAIHIEREGDVPTIDFNKCVGCGKCVAACPRNIIELAVYSKAQPMVWVACSNRDKGALAMKECEVACIGCGICMKKCPEKAVSVISFLAHIDYEKCVGCMECANACPRKSIVSKS